MVVHIPLLPNMKTKPFLFTRLKDHFGGDPAKLPVVSQNYAFYERANLHLAIEELSEAAETPPQVVGVVDVDDRSPSLAKLSRGKTARCFDEGPVEFVDEPLPAGQRLSCVKRGLYLFQGDAEPVALLISEQQYVRSPGIIAEVMAPTKACAEKFIHRLTRSVRHGKAFRGHVLSLERECYGGTIVQFHALPQVQREDVILPEKLLDRIERHTVAFSEHSKRLAASGRHLKRGILLYGPPAPARHTRPCISRRGCADARCSS